jgi:alpha-1,2-rhamnosyltransferase
MDHNAGGRPGNIFIECTTTYRYGGNSGIQRTVRSIVNNSRDVGQRARLICQPIVWTGRRFIRIRQLQLHVAAFRTPERTKHRVLALRRRLKRIRPLRVAVKLLLPWRLRRAAVALVKGFRDKVLIPLAELRYRRVRPGAGDVLLLLDSSWHAPPWQGVDRARARGAVVGAVIYDLIPLRLPETCDPHLVDVFGRWIVQVARRADFYVAISRAVRDELLAYLGERPGGGGALPPAGAFRLGAGLDHAAAGGGVRAALRELFAPPRRCYLTVATVEPRKNHAYLLDAFEALWARGADVSLCLVGKIGWKCERVVDRIETHPQWRRRLFMFNDATDSELAFCYERAAGLIFPSICEGFGLPIVEALSKRLTVFASDIPIHRETGGEYCVYFDLSAPASLARLIERFEAAGELPPHRPPDDFRWPGWRESCRELIEVVCDLAGEVRARRPPAGG